MSVPGKRSREAERERERRAEKRLNRQLFEFSQPIFLTVAYTAGEMLRNRTIKQHFWSERMNKRSKKEERQRGRG